MAEPAAEAKLAEVPAAEAHEATAPQVLKADAHGVQETPVPEVSSAEPTSPPTADPAPQVDNADAASPAEAPNATESLTMEDKPEPQNPLTERFTEAEWDALKEFRKVLPETFTEGFPDKEGKKDAPITFWGVVIDPWKAAEDARVSVILMKFLRARNLNVQSSREMLSATLRWREEIDIEAVMKEEFPKEIFGALGYNYKTDKEGRPVSYNIYGGNKDIKAVFGDVRRFIRWRVQLMEQTVALCDFVTVDQTVQIHDYEGVSMTSRDGNSKQAASEATNVFNSHYPELLYKKFFINVPSFMAWIFWVFKSVIPSATFAKMNMVGTSHRDIKKALLPIIDEENLPKRYGGLAQGF